MDFKRVIEFKGSNPFYDTFFKNLFASMGNRLGKLDEGINRIIKEITPDRNPIKYINEYFIKGDKSKRNERFARYEIAIFESDDISTDIMKYVVIKELFTKSKELMKTNVDYKTKNADLPNTAHLYFVHHGWRSLFSILKVKTNIEMIPYYDIPINVNEPSFTIFGRMIKSLDGYKFEHEYTKDRKINNLGLSNYNIYNTIESKLYKIDEQNFKKDRFLYNLHENIDQENSFNIFEKNFIIYYNEVLDKSGASSDDIVTKGAITINEEFSGGNLKLFDYPDQTRFYALMKKIDVIISKNQNLIRVTDLDIIPRISYDIKGIITLYSKNKPQITIDFAKNSSRSMFKYIWYILALSNGVNENTLESLWVIYWENNLKQFVVVMKKFLDKNGLIGFIDLFIDGK